MHEHKLVRHADSLEDNVGREYGSRVTDLQSQLNGGQTTREVGHEGGSDNDRDHPHVQAAIERCDELNTRWVEEGNVVTRVEPKLVQDEGTDTFSTLVEIDAVHGSQRVALKRNKEDD